MNTVSRLPAPTGDIYPSRETLLAILDAMFDELYVLDANNVCIYVNKACERHYGLSPAELIGKSLMDSVHSGYWSPGIGLIAAREKRVATFEMMTNTGKKLMVTATPVLDGGGDVSMIVENIRDIARLMSDQADIETTRALFAKYYTSESLPELKENVSSIVAESRVMRETLDDCRMAARTDSTILLTGPTGSGKSLLARFIHESGPARQGPFITINCSAIPDQLFESELFGYAHGAFSGASVKGRKGIVELAQNGTLFLDEVNSIPYHLQSKLLHFLQERTYAPVGSNRLRKSTCRILAATNQDLRQLIREKEFRSDLYYRLSVLEIAVPGLEKRVDDIESLARRFLQKCNERLRASYTLTPEVLAYLRERDWPGSARELENCIERVTALSPGETLDLPTVRRLLPPPLVSETSSPASGGSPEAGIPAVKNLDAALESVEKRLVGEAWEQGRSSYKVAALLGISQNRAYRLIRKHLGRVAERRNGDAAIQL